VRLRLGSRGSALALWQARHVASQLEAAWPGLEVAVTIIKTEGDRHLETALAASGGKGVFVKEIEDALFAGAIDFAVHSLKDLPTDTPPGLAIAAIPTRHDPRDALVSPTATRVSDLPRGARVGTGSPRRRCQLLHVRPDLSCVDVRGNVDTRLAKLARGDFDALLLAVAGIERLGLTEAPYTAIPVATCVPAPGQGALAVETREEDSETRRLVGVLDDPASGSCVRAERSFLAALGAGCLAPAAALATLAAGALTVDGMVGEPDGTRLRRATVTGAAADAGALGTALAERLA
jgi:hydroxymethylbilane synthase